MTSSSPLVAANIGWLRQALSILDWIDDTVFATGPQDLNAHRVGVHFRHVLEFYECFLDGVEHGRIDYDDRKRVEAIEKSREAAATQIHQLIHRLEQSRYRMEQRVVVRLEDSEAPIFLDSSVGRELQSLSSHTVHHFALIAVTLNAWGLRVHPDFGVSPATLRYRASQVAPVAKEAA